MDTEDNSVPNIGNVNGDVFAGADARKVDANQYIENQVINQYGQIIQNVAHQQSVWSGTAPYKGLESFAIEHGEHFFGRIRLVEKLLDRVQESSFVCVAGPSGSGKTSLVQAGLLYSLSQGRVEGISPSNIHSFSLTHTPIDKLITSIFELTQEIEPEQSSAQKQIVIFIDQFEEIFTHDHEESERINFINLLVAAARDHKHRFIVIIAMRGEFIDDCIRYSEITDLINDQLQLVGEMSPAELTEAIMQPAVKNGIQIDTDLIVRIAQEMYGEPGTLPLMQFALKDLFESIEPEPGAQVKLKLQSYEDRGGVREALKRHANRTFRQLDTEQQKVADKIFSRLISIDEQGKVSRKSVAPSQLRMLDLDPERVDEVIEKLAAPEVRLITTGAIQRGDSNEDDSELPSEEYEPQITLTHERLITAWPHLESILKKESGAIILQGQTERAALIWDTNNRETSYLFKDLQLDRVNDAIRQKRISFEGTPNEFVTASLKQARWLRLRSRGVMSVVVFLLFPGILLGADAWMVQMKNRSIWQPISGFPSHEISAVTLEPNSSNDLEAVLCVGTSHIGIGCTYDYQTWNLYYGQLPSANPSLFNSRERFWGALSGSTWSGSARRVWDLDIDQANRQRIVAFLNEEGLYESKNSGRNWERIQTRSSLEGVPTDRIFKLHVDDTYLFLATSIFGPSAERGHLFISTDSGRSFNINLQSIDTGLINDFWAHRDDSTASYTIYFVSDRGIFQSLQSNRWEVEPLAKSDLGLEYISIAFDTLEKRFYLVAYNKTQKHSQLFWWSADQTTPKLFTRTPHKGAVRDLAINPTYSTPERIWTVFEKGDVAAVNNTGEWVDQKERPGWVWSRTNKIWFAPEEENGKYAPYVGHSDGILAVRKIGTESTEEE